ncbi:hypothetical protein LPUS_07111 [Lasallia pustulata]|uniref:DUF7924 domain-containing protein n=1 Tax=Lasallia pustulata TaxID=136370 RepID=A0A1W5D2S1_9LECA|nr:hypothetical protein LPUS_07111 [Lasallia pustulata]
MAHDHASKKNGRQLPIVKDQASSRSQKPTYKSNRTISEQSSSTTNHLWDLQTLRSPPTSNVHKGREHPQILHNPSTSSQKGKRGRDQQGAGHRSPPTQDQLPSKRLRTKPSSCTAERELHPEAATDISEICLEPIQYWIQTGRWPKNYSEQASQVREDFEMDKSPEKFGSEAFPHLPHLFERKRSSPSLSSFSSKNTLSTPQTPSGQLSREVKSAQYKNPDYEVFLEQKGSYMTKSPLGITDTSRDLYRTLLEEEQTVPQDTLFRDDLFDETCESVQGRNEAMVVRDISPLICPSAQVLRIFGAKHLKILSESVNEGWNRAAVFEGTRPQPDFSVGFGRSAFTQEQLDKLKPFVMYKHPTYFMATMRIYFPFLTCEVKCGDAALDVADRQNAHSMTIAVRALVRLFRFVKREKELDRELLAFSISHDNRSVRIYGHYPVIEGDKTTFYRHPIHEFILTASDGKEKWTAYKFTRNVYDHYSPKLHKIICSGIDDLPADINFDLSQSASFSQPTPQSSQQLNAESISGEPASKKPRNQGAAADVVNQSV